MTDYIVVSPFEVTLLDYVREQGRARIWNKGFVFAAYRRLERKGLLRSEESAGDDTIFELTQKGDLTVGNTARG